MSALLGLLLLSSGMEVSVVPGVETKVPAGYIVSNLDPNLNSTANSQFYIPNFVPGFAVGLPNASISWSSGEGYAKIGYSVGPWEGFYGGIPHYAIGPQCCNFVEVTHTQQFTQASWGNHYYSRAGLGAPGINIMNFTSVYGNPPAPVGLRTDWNWTLRFSLNWSAPVLMNPENEWVAIGVAAVQYVPNVPGKLVYTLINLWMDMNSSSSVSSSAGGPRRAIFPPTLVVYHPIQVAAEGNQTFTINLSPYLDDTLAALGIQINTTSPPLITYVYLNVEGYNVRWNTTLYSFYLLAHSTPTTERLAGIGLVVPSAVLAAGLAAVLLLVMWRRRQAYSRPVLSLSSASISPST